MGYKYIEHEKREINENPDKPLESVPTPLELAYIAQIPKIECEHSSLAIQSIYSSKAAWNRYKFDTPRYCRESFRPDRLSVKL